ncbi:ATP-dependent DNA helicase PIF1 [Golovinomyces cichoracearum]|uniref:ATP-dependent DNA helicase n=1 Tax=Golovinomyces cichoracearum TaxID=62708 RepID=A0A420J959_9PEZI|nr:ATP-dependent DNA helicase PIF1 [Golovinomyces cichoracearum]
MIDEISMLSATLLDNLSLLAQDIKGNYESFRGIKLLLFGDFLQLPPVSNLWHESAKWAFDSDNSWGTSGTNKIQLLRVYSGVYVMDQVLQITLSIYKALREK